MDLKLLTAATEEPIGVGEFKAHARIDADDEDTDNATKVLAARVHVENLTNRALITSTWQLFLSSWPTKEGGRILVPLGNLQSAAVTYTDATGPHTVDPATYEVDLKGENTGEILLAEGCSWPSSTLKKASPICIEFVCGWPDAASVPQPIKSAILLLAAHFYRNREAVTIGRTTVESMPLKMAVDALLAPYILWRF